MTRRPGYLVVCEDPHAGEDEAVVFAVDVPRPPDHVVADFGAKVSSMASPMAVWGLVVTLTGTLLMLVAGVLFLLNYPEAWSPTATQTGMVRTVVGLGLAGTLLLLVGNLLVGFGRQPHAQGTLHSLRFVRPDD